MEVLKIVAFFSYYLRLNYKNKLSINSLYRIKIFLRIYHFSSIDDRYFTIKMIKFTQKKPPFTNLLFFGTAFEYILDIKLNT